MVLVTGSNSAAGKSLVSQLLKDGYSVRTFDQYSYNYFKDSCEVLTGSIKNERELASACKGVDVIFHFLEEEEITSRGRSHMRDINVEGTRKLVAAAKECGVKHIIFKSSWEVYSRKALTPISEDSKLKPTSPLGKDKKQCELILERYSGNMKVTVLRPSIEIGPGINRSFLLLMFYMAVVEEDKIMSIYNNGQNHLQICHPADLANAGILTMKSKKKGIFNIGGGSDPLTLELYSTVFKKLGIDVSLSEVSSLKLQFMSLVSGVFNLHLFSPAHKALLKRDIVLNISRATSSIQWRPSYTSEDALFEAIAWYKDDLHK